jgi:hypothetical protein
MSIGLEVLDIFSKTFIFFTLPMILCSSWFKRHLQAKPRWKKKIGADDQNRLGALGDMAGEQKDHTG